MRRYLPLALLLSASVALAGEVVYVKYRGPVDLTPFQCEWTPHSSVVKRLCYDVKERYIVVRLKETYYHYCEMPTKVFTAWRSSDSLGRFYNDFIKGNFDCRINRMPEYK